VGRGYGGYGGRSNSLFDSHKEAKTVEIDGIFKVDSKRGEAKEGAVLLVCENVDGETVEKWIPKKCIEDLDESALEKDEECTLNVHEWFAKQEGLTEED
jgi:tetrahydromethanopterin S-methyltransferase subunit A